jgi:hypothetical protein
MAKAVSGVVVDGLESAVLMLDVGVCGLATAVEVCTFRLAESEGEIRVARLRVRDILPNEANALLWTMPVRAGYREGHRK